MCVQKQVIHLFGILRTGTDRDDEDGSQDEKSYLLVSHFCICIPLVYSLSTIKIWL